MPSAPNHVAASYPTPCISCHTTWVTTAWLGAVFTHTAFQLPHPPPPRVGGAQPPADCTDCHINSTNYAVVSCINACHTGNSPHADRAGTTAGHARVSGFSHGATSCYNCHKGCCRHRPATRRTARD